MFDWLKRRMHKDDDIEDIRSNVLGSSMDEPDFPRRERFDADLEDPLKKLGDKRFENFEEPPGFNTIDTRTQERNPRSYDNKSENYDIMDRLNLIESQLAAIRSQTETINERLKNMESRLGLQRRY